MVSNSRDESIDVLRGIAMLCVMLGHLGYVPETFMRWLIPFYVPSFFFITGYLKKTSECSRAEIAKRFIRLILPYALYNILLIICYIFIHHISIQDILFAIKGILYSRFCFLPDVKANNNIYFFTVSNSPLWFLTALFSAEVFFEIFMGRNKERIVFKCIVLLMIGFGATYLKILLPWSLDTAMIGTIFMVAGYYWKQVGESSFKWWILIPIYLLIAYINPQANMSVRYYGPWKISIVLFVMAGISGSVLMKKVSEWVAQCRYVKILRNCFCIIGQNSMPILALHWFLFSFCDIAVEKMGISIAWRSVYGIFKISLILVLCVTFSKVIRLPLRYKEK